MRRTACSSRGSAADLAKPLAPTRMFRMRLPLFLTALLIVTACDVPLIPLI